MADIDLIEEVNGFEIPVDPMDLLHCDSCQ